MRAVTPHNHVSLFLEALRPLVLGISILFWDMSKTAHGPSVVLDWVGRICGARAGEDNDVNSLYSLFL